MRKDIYGILKKENEDPNRESLLDESLNQFIAKQNETGTIDIQ